MREADQGNGHSPPAGGAAFRSALIRNVVRLWRSAVWSFGVAALVMVVLAFTPIPFHVHRWLGLAGAECSGPVGAIVVLGGSGMPSGPELLRLHRAASAAQAHPEARVVVVHPGDGRVRQAMVEELLLRGVSADRLDTLGVGDNTREQALRFADRWPSITALALVTAPEQMRRSVGAFRKVHGAAVCGLPAWDHAMDHPFRYQHGRVGGKAYLPDVGDRPGLRYTFWNYLKLQVTCLREFVALGYYWLNDWL